MSDASPFVTLRAGRADRDEARLRMGAAIVSSLAAGLYALARPGPLAITVSIAVLAASVAWAARVNRAVERGTHETLLALAPTGLTLAPNAEIAWSRITAVEVDEDRLVVLVHRNGEPLVLEPVYDGMSVYDLAALVERCRSFGQSRAP